MKVFDFEDYKSFLKTRIDQMPKDGRGFRLRMAKYLGVHTTLVSQVINGSKNFTPEQAALLCELLALSQLESQYFLLLVQRSRAGNEALRRQLSSQLRELQAKGQKLVNRLPARHILGEEAKGVFYSSWHYSGVRLCTSLASCDSAARIAERLGLPLVKVVQVLEFLQREGLVIERDGRLTLGPHETHLDSDSPQIPRHHANWRLKGLERLHPLQPDELMFTSPLTIARTDMGRVRKVLLEAIDGITQVVLGSTPDTLACVNVDWYEAGGRPGQGS